MRQQKPCQAHTMVVGDFARRLARGLVLAVPLACVVFGVRPAGAAVTVTATQSAAAVVHRLQLLEL